MTFVVVTCLAAGAAAQVSMGTPRVVLIVESRQASAETMATRLFMIAREKLHRSRSLELVDGDRLLGARREGRATAKRARVLYDEGRKNYDMLELKQAVDLLQHASRELETRLGELTDRRLYTDIHTYLGSALVLLGDKSQGRQVFRKLLSFNDKAELNPMVFPPELTAVFEQTAAELRRSERGAMNIQVLPKGTEVWVDCIFRGFSPVQISNLVEGEHILRLVRRGHHSQGWKQEVKGGMSVLIRQQMEPLPGYERFQSVTRRVAQQADSVAYPDGVDTLTRKMQADRLLLFLVSDSNQEILVQARYYDRNFRTCLKSSDKAFDSEDPSYLEQLGVFVTSVIVNLGDSAPPVVSGPVTMPLPVPDEPVEEPEEPAETPPDRQVSSSLFSTWWFWTLAGALVAGGVGLTLVLTLGDGGESTPAGEVIFKF